MSPRFSADVNALLKLLLHAAKHPSCSVNGLLVGKENGGVVGIVDIIPLFHTSLALSPPLEIALAMVNSHINSDNNLSIVGYYEGDSQYGRPELSKPGISIADKLAQLYKSMKLCVLVDSTKLADMIRAEEETLPFQVLVHKSGKWECSGKDSEPLGYEGGSLRSLLLEHIDQGKHRSFVDFDEHLDDVTRDYMNPSIKA
ncbi:hypothetical protein BSKO_07922 [Bryopsis sp. KO-2023]|nr:hypothetical protein BSKO_07922 [Bryopsis sp. KO-2023]